MAGFPPLGRSGDLESPGDGQIKSRTYRVTLADLTKSSEFRTKEDLQWAAQFIASNSERLGEIDPELLAKIDEMQTNPTCSAASFPVRFFPLFGASRGSGPAPRRCRSEEGRTGGSRTGSGTGCCRKTGPDAQGSGPQVMVGVRNLMIDECSFSGKTSLAAGNCHGHVPPRESGGTRVNLNRRMKRAFESKGPPNADHGFHRLFKYLMFA